MDNDELMDKIEQISATIGMDIEDEELKENEKKALLNLACGKITLEEYYDEYRGKNK